MSIKDVFVRCKVVFDRGKQWIGYINFIMIVFVTASNMREYEAFKFMSSGWWMLIIIIASIIFISFLGYLEFRLKTFQKEMEFLSSRNPVMKTLLDNQEKILRNLIKEVE